MSNSKQIAAPQRFFLPLALMFCLLLAVAGQAHAQTVKMYGDNDKPSAQEIADILANSLRSKTRGIRLSNASQAAASSTLRFAESGAATAAQSASKAEPNAFSLPVQFAFDSARLMPAAYEQLDAVAGGMKLLEGSVTVVIEGHTDAHGKAGYNASLSQRRADSVRRYLAEKHNVDMQLLKVEGKGSVDPINKQNPYSAENRRVQFRAG